MQDNQIIIIIATSGLMTCRAMPQQHVCLTISQRGASLHDFFPCFL